MNSRVKRRASAISPRSTSSVTRNARRASASCPTDGYHCSPFSTSVSAARLSEWLSAWSCWKYSCSGSGVSFKDRDAAARFSLGEAGRSAPAPDGAPAPDAMAPGSNAEAGGLAAAADGAVGAGSSCRNSHHSSAPQVARAAIWNARFTSKGNGAALGVGEGLDQVHL